MSEAILPSGSLRAQRARELQVQSRCRAEQVQSRAGAEQVQSRAEQVQSRAGVQAIQQAVSAEPPCRRTAHGLDSSTRGSPVWVEVQHAHAWEERAAADVERATELGTGERVATLRC